jgi:hypothetical protein
MSAAVKGKQLSWGIPSALKTAATTIFTDSGVVTSVSVEDGGGTTVINDEDDDAVTRIDHAGEHKVSFEVHATASTVKPAKGTEILGATLGTIDGVNFSTGRTFVDDSKADYLPNGVKKITISATHYPAMGADS